MFFAVYYMSFYFRLHTHTVHEYKQPFWFSLGRDGAVDRYVHLPLMCRFCLARNQLLTIHVEMSKSFYHQKLTQKCENCKNPHQYPKWTWNIGYQVIKLNILCHRLSKIRCPTLSFAFARGPRFGHGITSEGPAK